MIEIVMIEYNNDWNDNDWNNNDWNNNDWI